MSELSDTDDPFVAPLISSMTITLSRHGFILSTRASWLREFDWKEELIELVSLGNSVLINLYIRIPCYRVDTEPGWETLSVKGLGHIVGGTRPDVRYPALRSPVVFAENISKQIEGALDWYDQFATLSTCLKCLRAGAKRPGTPAYQAIEGYLMSRMRE